MKKQDGISIGLSENEEIISKFKNLMGISFYKEVVSLNKRHRIFRSKYPISIHWAIYGISILLVNIVPEYMVWNIALFYFCFYVPLFLLFVGVNFYSTYRSSKLCDKIAATRIRFAALGFKEADLISKINYVEYIFGKAKTLKYEER